MTHKDQLAQHQTQRKIEGLLSVMSPSNQQIFRAVFIERKSKEDVARVMGIPLQALNIKIEKLLRQCRAIVPTSDNNDD